MSTIESINRSKRVPVQESCATAEKVGATSKDPLNQKIPLEKKVESLASSLSDSLKPPSSTSLPSLMTSDLTEDYISAEDYMSAADVHKKNGDLQKAAECYKSAADAYEKNGELQKAIKCTRLASSEYWRLGGDRSQKLGASKKANQYYSLAAYVCLENPDSSRAQRIRNIFSSNRS